MSSAGLIWSAGAAKAVLPPKAWAYNSSASDDEITIRENRAAYQRVRFRLCVLRDVTNRGLVNNLGCKSSLPVRIVGRNVAFILVGIDYILVRDSPWLTRPSRWRIQLHKSGRQAWCYQNGDLLRPAFIISTRKYLTSLSFRDSYFGLVLLQRDRRCRSTRPAFFLQLYVNCDREITKKYVQHAEKRVVKALFITVDGPQLARREKECKDQGVARAISSFIDPSNHGARQLDTSLSGIENLIDIVAALKTKGSWQNPNFAVFVDGGVRHASDVLKAIALGASAVGVGSGLPDDGERAVGILRSEFAMNMRLIGARTIGEIVPEMVDASALRSHAGFTPADNLYNAIYQPLGLAAFKNAKL
ncbi:hypothetical protein BJ912DRAFT_1126546 [Pholiota molesta]|nr:hypothetical protein BJ912DRAFT_1126546 [Pholiota molesta]